MKFILQSLNDVVTNSSMEVYQEATEGTVVAIQEIINTVLKISGSDKKCQDLFDIKINYDEMLWKYFDNEVCKAIKNEDLSLQFRAQLEEVYNSTSGKQADGHYMSEEARYQALLDANLIGPDGLCPIEDFTNHYGEDWDDYGGVTTEVLIIPRVSCDAGDIKVLAQINDLFHIEASYNS